MLSSELQLEFETTKISGGGKTKKQKNQTQQHKNHGTIIMGQTPGERHPGHQWDL